MSLRDLPPLAALRAFAALAETRSVSQAGALLNVSHAAISQQVRNLEAHLGLKLIARDGRGTALTADGAQLAQVVRTAFHAIADEVAALTGADADRPLQVSTTPMFAANWLMPRIEGFRAAHPSIDLMIDAKVENVELAPGGIDLAIRFGRGDWPGVESERLVHTHFVIAASRALIGDREISSPEDLLDYPWLQQTGTAEASEWLKSHGVTQRRVKGMLEVPGYLLLDGLRRGQGITATTRTFVERDVAAGDVVVLFEDNDPAIGYYVLTRPGVLRPAARTFIAWLRREARDDTAKAEF